MSIRFLGPEHASEVRKRLYGMPDVEYFVDVWLDATGEEEGTPISPNVDEHFLDHNTNLHWIIQRYNPNVATTDGEIPPEVERDMQEHPEKYPVLGVSVEHMSK